MDRLLRLPSPNLSLMPLALAMASRITAGQTLEIVKVGAFAGHDGDYLRQFLEQEGENVRAVLAEPDPWNFELLRRNLEAREGILLVRAAVGATQGPGILHTVRTGGRWATSPVAGQIGSLHREHLLQHDVLEDEIETVPVQVIRLASLLEIGGMESPDFLIVDAEGADHDIVTEALSLPEPPPLICFEHRHMTSVETESIFRTLGTLGYRWTHDRFDTLAMRFR